MSERRSLNPEEDYLTLNRPSPGETVTRVITWKPMDFGYEGDVLEVSTKQTIIPVQVKGAEVLVRVSHEPEFKTTESGPAMETGKEKIGVTVIHIGGAASTDWTHRGDEEMRVRNALIDNDLKLNNLIILGHPEGSPISTGEGKFDENDFGDSAEALRLALQSGEIKIKGPIVLSGLSAGGAVATALAAALQEAGVGVSALVLMDPAGMGESKNLAYKFAVGDAVAEYKLHRKKGVGQYEAFKLTWEAVSKSMTTGRGVPKNIFELVGAFFPDQVHKKMIKAWGLEGDMGAAGLRIDLLSKDSTKRFRGALKNKNLDVVVSPALMADVVNFLKEANKWPENLLTEAANDEKSPARQTILEQGIKTLRQMFPEVDPDRMHLLPWWEGATHTSVGSEQKYMDNVMKLVEKIIKDKRGLSKET